MTESTETSESASPATLSPPGQHQQPPSDRVPADQRILGIDKRTIWPGVVLLIVWALWSQAMPWIDDQIELDNPIVAGDVINLGFGEVTFVPTVGWDLRSGVLLTEGNEDAASVPASAVLLSETVSYSAKSGNFDGTPDELLDRMIKVNDSLDDLGVKDEQGRTSIQNADGVPGEVAYLVGVDQVALIATFVFAPEGGTKIGVEIEVRGEPGSLQELVEEFAPMIETTTYRPASQEANS